MTCCQNWAHAQHMSPGSISDIVGGWLQLAGPYTDKSVLWEQLVISKSACELLRVLISIHPRTCWGQRNDGNLNLCWYLNITMLTIWSFTNWKVALLFSFSLLPEYPSFHSRYRNTQTLPEPYSKLGSFFSWNCVPFILKPYLNL